MTSSAESMVRPFRGLRPAPDFAAAIAAPPYDVVSTAEARALAGDNPWSFLRVSRAEIELPDGTDPYADAVYARAGENLAHFIERRVLVHDRGPGYYVYRMTHALGVQTGVALGAAVAAYRDGRIRKHELTRPAKETDRVRQIEATGAITGPVLLVHRANTTLHALLDSLTQRPADVVVPALDGVRHELWAVFASEAVAAITECFAAMPRLYIADGHHRSAAAARIAETRHVDAFLAVSFPDDEVTILDYNRLVRDLNGHSPTGFLQALESRFDIEPATTAVRPTTPGALGMYLDGRWYALQPRDLPPTDDPVARLDVSRLTDLILEPLLGITDQRTDPRIDFVGGSRGAAAVAARVDSGEMAVGFMLFPTTLADLMAVADADAIMPPKSTWFEPKLADGMISLSLADATSGAR